MQEFIGFVVFMAAGVIAAVTKEFDIVMYASVVVFGLILLFLDWRGKKAKVITKAKVVKEIKADNDKEPEPKPKGLTTGLFTNYQ